MRNIKVKKIHAKRLKSIEELSAELGYTPYTSNSFDATDIQASPGGASKLCLSCHDGTLAIGVVNILNGQSPGNITMTGTGPGDVMPFGDRVDQTVPDWVTERSWTRSQQRRLAKEHIRRVAGR